MGFVNAARIVATQLVLGILSLLLGMTLGVYFFLNSDIKSDQVESIAGRLGGEGAKKMIKDMLDKQIQDLRDANSTLVNSRLNSLANATFDIGYITSPFTCGLLYTIAAGISLCCIRHLAIRSRGCLVVAMVMVGSFSVVSSGAQGILCGWYSWYIWKDYLFNEESKDARKKILAGMMIGGTLVAALELFLTMLLISVSCCCPGKEDVVAVELHEAVVHPETIGKGLGRKLSDRTVKTEYTEMTDPIEKHDEDDAHNE